MDYDEDLARRIRELLVDTDAISEKPMFGGLKFLLHGNMAVGVAKSGGLVVRVGPEGADDALNQPHTRPFDMTGRPIAGWILVAPDGFKTKRQLAAWVTRGMNFAATLPCK